MLRIVTFGALFAAICVVGKVAAQDLGSYAFGKQYVVSINENVISRTPDWEPDDDNPPLAAKKAIKLATQMKDTLVNDDDDFKWRLESAALEPWRNGTNKWYWVVTYNAKFQGASSGQENFLRLIVLMDGTVMKPKISREPH